MPRCIPKTSRFSASIWQVRAIATNERVTGRFVPGPKERQMLNYRLMLTAAVCALAAPALAQEAPAPQAAQDAQTDEGNVGDIVVTATRRSEALSDIPLAVSAVTAQSLANSGASDIRALNQLSPSLLVSSTSSEAAAGGARIRGIGTVGDNPGLESSVATFVDGVYRSRAGVGLTELGAIDRIEVLRGPQGTLFGRNASAGLISIITAKPSFKFAAEGDATYGNFETIRVGGGVTGPISETIAARLDGIYFKRDGFLKDVVSGRRINNRDRWLVRGQLLFQPSDDLSVRIIGDYAQRKEECCGATYLPSRNVSRNPDGSLNFTPNQFAAIERGLGGIIRDDTYSRETSITPGQGYRGDVKDWGISGELNWTFGNANLTSITAYRDWRLVRGQDADFNNLDILRRLGTDADAQRQSFQTFTQELRLQGSAFDDKLDWLVGGYYANEKLKLRDNLSYGADFERFGNCVLVQSFANSAGQQALVSPTSPGCINVPVATAIATNLAVPAALRGPVGLFAGLAVPGQFGFRAVAAALGQPALSFNNVRLDDSYAQTSRNFAIFTHNVVKFNDWMSLTLGARYTNERKTLDATFTDTNAFCRAIAASPTLAGLANFPCVIPSLPTGSFSQSGARKSEDRVTGTAVLSIKPTDGLLVYGSYSRGYKAGGFNLDRSGFTRQAISPTVAGPITVTNLNLLTFEPEIVDAFEVGYKLNKPGFDLNIAAFYQKFSGFQLNTFNGLNFIVVNIAQCKTGLNGADSDSSNASGACTSGTKAGVSSKGLEIEAFLRPVRNVGVNLGLTYTNTRYGNDLVGAGGTPLPAALFQLPGSRLSNSSEYVATASFTWTPPLGDSGLSGLFYVDGRLQSDTNTGSDLDVEKVQDGFAVANARVGIRGAEQRWAIEFWANNVLNEQFQQVSFDAPLQGGSIPASQAVGGSTTAVRRGFIAGNNQLYGVFLGEPRTYGVTARFKF
jgi:iron complex outermembrane recepter protein